MAKQRAARVSLLYALISLCPLFFMSMGISLIRFFLNMGPEIGEWVYFDLFTAMGSAVFLILGVIGAVWYKRHTNRRGYVSYKVENADESNEQALAFYLSVILPVISNAAIDGLIGFVCFWMIVIMTVALLVRTKACYANPVLVMMGLNLFRVTISNSGGALGELERRSSVNSLWVLTNESEIKQGDTILVRPLSGLYYFARIHRHD